MYLVRIGYKTINLEYLIEAADSDLGAPPGEAPSGGIRISVYPGKSCDVIGDDASSLRLHIQDNLSQTPDAADGQRARPKGGRMRTGSSPTPSKSSPREE